MNTFGIDPRVWMAVVGKQEATPALVAFAASLCIDGLSEGAMDAQGKPKGPHVVVWQERVPSAWDPRVMTWTPRKSISSMDEADRALGCDGASVAVAVRASLAEWVLAQGNAEIALNALAKWDRKLATWCAAAIAESVAHHSRPGEKRPLQTANTVRDWIRGKATAKQVDEAISAASLAANDAHNVYIMTSLPPLKSAAVAATEAAYAAYDAALYAIHGPSPVVFRAVAHAAVAGVNARAPAVFNERSWKKAIDAEFKRLREVVAKGVVSYPNRGLIVSSQGISTQAVVAGVVGAVLGAAVMRAARKA